MTKIICKNALGLCQSCWQKERWKNNVKNVRRKVYLTAKKWQNKHRKEYNAYMLKYLKEKYHSLHPDARYFKTKK